MSTGVLPMPIGGRATLYDKPVEVGSLKSLTKGMVWIGMESGHVALFVALHIS